MISRLDALLKERDRPVKEWFADKRRNLPMPIYTSVDLRNAGYKIAPVDTNLYPSGFNNLCNSLNEDCTISFREAISASYGGIKKIIILAEARATNPWYTENLKSLLRCIEKDDYEVRAGIAADDLWKDKIVFQGIGEPMTLSRVYREGNFLRVVDFIPDIIINNNDFAGGIPEFIKNVSQPINPPPELGWAHRRKSANFAILERLVGEFSSILGIDPWLLLPVTQAVRDVNFITMSGIGGIASAIDDVMNKTRAKYTEYNVTAEPYVFVKSDYGTYGLSIITANSSSDFLTKIKKEKARMQRGKGGVAVTEVIVQEGIPTMDLHEDHPAEPVIYTIGGKPVGGFFRVNPERTLRENLNSPGMTFSPICFHKVDDVSQGAMIRVWSVLAEITAIAAAHEMNYGFA